MQAILVALSLNFPFSFELFAYYLSFSLLPLQFLKSELCLKVSYNL